MNLSELFALFQYEVQKSYCFIEMTAKGQETPDAAIPYYALDRVEFEVPVAFQEKEANYDPVQVEGLPTAVVILNLPFSAETATQPGGLPDKPFAGKVVAVRLLGTDDGTANQGGEQPGRIRFALKPALTM